MRHILAIGLMLAVLALSAPVAADPPAVGPEEVLAMMDRLPGTEMGRRPYTRWSRTGQAMAIAAGISAVAIDKKQAAELVVYDLYEGGNRLHAVGDGGHSHGPWQLSDAHTPVAVAEHPVKGAHAWVGQAESSRLSCAESPPDDQLAVLASGATCTTALSLVRRRARLVRVALGLETL